MQGPVLSNETVYEKIKIEPRVLNNQYSDNVIQKYCLNQLIEFIINIKNEKIDNYQKNDFFLNKNICKIALQFPDEYLCDSSEIVYQLDQGLNSKLLFENSQNKNYQKIELFILGDTSYSSCCVDETAAEHVKADFIVHFGDACLSRVGKYPVIYNFGNTNLLIKPLIDQILNNFPQDKSIKLAIMASAPFNSHVLQISNILQKDYSFTNVIPILLSLDSLPKFTNISSNTNPKPVHVIPSLDNYSSSQPLVLSPYLPNRIHPNLDDLQDTNILSQYTLIHIGSVPSSALLQYSTIFSSVLVYDPNSQSLSKPKTALQKRYKAVQVAKHASTIGILVNTLSIFGRTELLSSIKNSIELAGKKSYTFVVGKVTVAKLANFEVVDAWVVIGCSHNGLSFITDDDSNSIRSFYKPMVTPFELYLALLPEVTWPGTWITSFSQLISLNNNLPSLLDQDETKSQDLQNLSIDDEDNIPESNPPSFNPVTGEYSFSKPLNRWNLPSNSNTRQHIELESDNSNNQNNNLLQKINNNTELSSRFYGQLSIRGTVSTAADSLKSRSWTGLGSDFKDNPADQDIKKGRSGLAKGYTHSSDSTVL